MANAFRKGFGATSARPVIELQRLELKPGSADDAVRLTRELWEILRRKQGCVVYRLYHSPSDPAHWLAYSEWRSLSELAGARRELARSPLYRRQHSMLKASSERAYEAFGSIRSIRGAASGPESRMLLIALDRVPEPAEEATAFLKHVPGYVSHVMMREVGDPEVMVCVAIFDTAASAARAIEAIAEQEKTRGLRHVAQLFAS